MIPILSIIIPCYNSYITAEETFQSVLEQDYENWEAIIVNDGSPDNIEKIALKWVEKDSRFKYFKKENGGLGTARNYGINKAQGKYILPLDSDNRVASDYAKTAIPILNNDENIGVVYGNAIYIGEESGDWIVGDYNKLKMLKSNYIDACAIIRKEVYGSLGLYDTSMPYQGVEDWELWIRLSKSHFSFHYLKQVTFFYRVTNTSMIRSFEPKMTEANIAYIYTKHFWFYVSTIWKHKTEDKNWSKMIANIVKKIIKRLLFLI